MSPEELSPEELSPEELSTARTAVEPARQRKRPHPALIWAAATIALFGFSELACPDGSESGLFLRNTGSDNPASTVVTPEGTGGGYAPNSINTPRMPRAARPRKSPRNPDRTVIEPRWPNDDFSMGGYAPDTQPLPRDSR
ncbi:MAG TPA: hypothetical protein VFP34_07595 [Microlunatus sp.]|nr:hypothetical protein [Microlunatus sp.]